MSICVFIFQVTMLPHTGFIYYSDIVQDTPPDLRRKAARLVAAKSTLAARVDACHESSDGHVGQMLREEIEKKLDKLTEPPPVKFVKPLPKPIDAGRKKRGGKRVRKMKERYAMTEFRKQANRLNFADIEDDAYQEDLGYTRGTIGKTGTGRIRLPQIDEKTKVCFACPTFPFLINKINYYTEAADITHGRCGRCPPHIVLFTSSLL